MSQDTVLQRAESLLELHRPQDALALASAALAQDPGSAAALCVIARSHIEMGDHATAATAAERAVSLAPEDPYPARLASAALAGLGDTDAARHWAQTAISLDATEPSAHRILALLEADERHADQARLHAETAVDLEPEDADGHYVYGLVLQHEGRFRGAEQALRHALVLDPHHAGALSALGETVAHLGASRDAAELIRLAASTDVRDESIHQDMLRYVRGAAFGFATWPIIGLLIVLAVAAIGGEAGAAAVYGAIALVLVAARMQRLYRFPRPVRELLRRRERTRAAWQITVPPGAGTGFRPWWWILLVRVPLSARTAAAWLLLLAWAVDGDGILALVLLPLVVWMTVRAVQRHQRRVATLALYS